QNSAEFQPTNLDELIQEIKQLKETVILLESRLSTCKNTSEDYFIMNKILTRIKRLTKYFESIAPNQYDIYSMECLGLCI
ncbi:hypothetical protein, partial [Planktothrix sp.]|uniref:hypothetical protein n=1 Tax=Planktothrix sp. TaxID=3088171 RepID=UPI0038D39009